MMNIFCGINYQNKERTQHKTKDNKGSTTYTQHLYHNMTLLIKGPWKAGTNFVFADDESDVLLAAQSLMQILSDLKDILDRKTGH